MGPTTAQHSHNPFVFWDTRDLPFVFNDGSLVPGLSPLFCTRGYPPPREAEEEISSYHVGA